MPRQIPAYVRRVNADERYLPKSVLKNLKDFRRSNSLRQKYVKIIGFTDRFIFQLKVPARNIPKSYAIWEKHVDMKGKTIKIYKISVGPKGELIHNKPKMR